MNYKKLAIYTFFILLALSGVYQIVQGFFNIPEDNPVEEKIEDVIVESTGIEIELTP